MRVIDEEQGIVRGSGPSADLPPATEWNEYDDVEYEVTDREGLTYKLVQDYWVTKHSSE